jgi:hypothetical protein
MIKKKNVLWLNSLSGIGVNIFRWRYSLIKKEILVAMNCRDDGDGAR